ncbi:MAG: hypothetical protein CVU39_02180 [Chloroflexi bacterium HGW-Chloroflexi-10]|nr:MAG: hypothetical protein CVU39_02180 [Chloroflexi bacterium HGW-Chloroflexi-10]
MLILTKNKWFLRFIISMAVGMIFGFFVSEASFALLKESDARSPEIIVLEIPEGTSERIANGQSIPTIPENMVFYSGDKLLVKNYDSVSHQLGPVWVPAGTTGTLSLEKAEKYLLTCTFQTGNLLGLDVRDHATVDIRAQGVLAIGLPSGILLWLFSLGFTPKEKTSLGSQAE